jgi:2-polyprenyl-3-methyl-5-hydroxy-6-metoxy-1,4-benzoquinol methylase
MISSFSLHFPKWVETPIRTLTRTFPGLNAASWDLQYQLGLWNYLDSERAGHGLLQVMQKYAPKASILDLGCGASANLPLMPGTYRSYHGVDISAKAIERARAMGRADCSYETADILSYVPGEAYDAIILSEVLCYLPTAKISGFLRRLSGYLTPTGVILIQVWAGAMNASLTAAIEGTGLPMAQEENGEPDAGRPRKIAELDGGRPRTIYILRAPASAGGSEGTA